MTSRYKRKTAAPDPRLRLDPVMLECEPLPREFFRLDTTRVARALIGAWIARRCNNQWYGARIVETEAYLGSKDAAAHSYKGRRTPRVEPMYMDGGHLYVFFVYGMHHCANIVTGKTDVAEAVLLRAAERPDLTPAKLLSGPGKLCAAFGITTASSGVDLLSDNAWRVFKPKADNVRIGVSRRVGVDYAGEAASWPLRFFDLDSAAVSGPPTLLAEARKLQGLPPPDESALHRRRLDVTGKTRILSKKS